MNKFIGEYNTTKLLVVASNVQEALKLADRVLTEKDLLDQCSIVGNDKHNDVTRTFVRYFNESIDTKAEFIVINSVDKYKKINSSLSAILKV